VNQRYRPDRAQACLTSRRSRLGSISLTGFIRTPATAVATIQSAAGAAHHATLANGHTVSIELEYDGCWPTHRGTEPAACATVLTTQLLCESAGLQNNQYSRAYAVYEGGIDNEEALSDHTLSALPQ